MLRVRKIYVNAGEPSYPSLGIDATLFPFPFSIELLVCIRTMTILYMHPHTRPYRQHNHTLSLHNSQLSSTTIKAHNPTLEGPSPDVDGDAPEAAAARL